MPPLAVSLRRRKREKAAPVDDGVPPSPADAYRRFRSLGRSNQSPSGANTCDP
ncbi:hypothetical protein [Crateriforma conspicua]|uniref:hypothetical protein n=1 Tax=Crateriforma conspicua TaxID=2527996 RepID=UPI0018CE4FA5|nr:hypothetical protein [Crateriforma conspicua]